MLGFMAVWGGWHLYLDHQVFHAMQQYLIQQAQQQQARPPAPR